MSSYIFIPNIISECDASACASAVTALCASVGAEGESAHVDACWSLKGTWWLSYYYRQHQEKSMGWADLWHFGMRIGYFYINDRLYGI